MAETSPGQTETQKGEFILGDSSTISVELEKNGRSAWELTAPELERVIPTVASGITGERRAPPLVHASIKGNSANLQINTKVMEAVEVEASLVLENSQEPEGEILTREVKVEIKTKVPKWFPKGIQKRVEEQAGSDIQKRAEEWGGRVNTELEDYVVGSLKERGIKTTGAKLWFTENDTFRIEVEDEDRLKVLETQAVPREETEAVSPPPLPLLPPPPPTVQPEPAREPETIVEVAKEQVPSPEAQELTPLEKLRQEAVDNRRKLRETFGDLIAGKQTEEQFKTTLKQSSLSLFALNLYLNSQISPESLSSGASSAADKYLSLGASLKSLQEELGKEDIPLRQRYDMVLDYSKKLLGKGGKTWGGRLGFFKKLQGKTFPMAAREIKEESVESAKSEHLAPSWVKPKAEHCELVRTVNPRTGKAGYLLYFWEDGQLKLQTIDEGGRGIGNEFIVKPKAGSLEEVNLSIQVDVKRHETKGLGLQITRNIPIEILEETRRKELQGLESEIRKKRRGFYSALENYEDAQANFAQAEAAYQRSITEKQYPSTRYSLPVGLRRTRSKISLETATEDKEKAVPGLEKSLLAFNNYLNKNIRVEAPGDDKDLFARYQELGQELEKLYQEKLKTASPEQRVDLFREYDKIFNDRLGVYIQIAKQRGQNPVPLKVVEETFVSPSQEQSKAQVQEIRPAIGIKGEDVVLVEVSFLSSKGKPSKPNFGELKSQEGASVGRRLSRVLEKWKALKDRGVPVVPWMWRSQDGGGLLTADLSKGGRAEVTDFDFLALHLENYGRHTKNLPSWLINNREDIRNKLVENAKLASELKFLVPLSSYRLVLGQKDTPPSVYLTELTQAVETSRSSQEMFRQNLDSIFDTLVRKLGLFSQEEWNKWRYKKVDLPELEKAA